MKIAFVTPWYGEDIPGGAETTSRQTAVHLHQAGHKVEILTTTLRDLYSDWGRNDHKPGVSQSNGLTVRRFPVQPRDRQTFDALNGRLMHNLPLSPAEEKTFIDEMIKAPDLYAFIRQHQDKYIFFFIPYMFTTTYYGGQICPQRSIMIPCMHDEGYARLGIYRDVLAHARAIIFHTDAESRLFKRLFGERSGQIQSVFGLGMDINDNRSATRFRQKFGLDTPFVLYAGRREAGKNIPLLLRYWQQYQSTTNRNLKLVLIGSGQVSIPAEAEQSIIDLGFVSEQDKLDAYAAASVFCMPSLHESFSLVIMESWLAQTPVLVHGRCDVTREHCITASGGLYFENYPEFSATLDYLLNNPETAQKMGASGRQYVLDNFGWETIMQKYEALLQQVQSP